MQQRYEVQAMNEQGIENLCNAIILAAVKDYRTALAKRDKDTINQIERFFRSDWYRQLTKVDGEFLISKIREEFHR